MFKNPGQINENRQKISMIVEKKIIELIDKTRELTGDTTRSDFIRKAIVYYIIEMTKVLRFLDEKGNIVINNINNEEIIQKQKNEIIEKN